MKKIRQLVSVPGKALAMAFLLSFTILHANSQIIATNNNTMQVSTTNISDNAFLSVYPNPVADEAKVIFNSSKYDMRYQLRIINNQGILLQNIEGTTLQGQNTIRIHVGNYPPGTYYVQLMTIDGRETLKMLKQPLNTFN